MEARRHGPGDLLVAGVERRRAADPVQDVELVEPALRCHRPRPSAPRTAKASSSRARDDAGWPHGLPWFSIERKAFVSSDGKRLSSRTRFRRSPTILSTCSMRTGHASTHAPQVTQSQTASYGIASSTMGLASAAGGDLRVLEAVGLADDRRVRDDVDAALRLDRHVADAHDQFLGVERLAGVVGRAGLLAAPAFRAGEPVEEILPAEVLEGLEPEGRVLGLEVHLRQLAAGRQLAEEDVREGRGDVQVLAERQVAQERRHQRDVGPPQDREHGLEDARRQVPERDRERVRDERAGDVAVRRDLEDLGEELGGDDAADHAEDDQRVPVEGQAARLRHEPTDIGPADRHEDDDRDDVLHRRDGGPQQAVERDREDLPG